MPAPIPLTNYDDDTTGPPVVGPASGALFFYLIPAACDLPPQAFFVEMAALPFKLTWSGSEYRLICAYATDARHANLILVYPQPGDWSGGLQDARLVLRQNRMIQFWWIFDWLLARYGPAWRTSAVIVPEPPDPAPFVPADYTAATVYNPDGSALDAGIYSVEGIVVTPVDGGLDLEYTVRNISGDDAEWPSFRLPIPVLDYRGVWKARQRWARVATPPFVNPSQIDFLYGFGAPNGTPFNALAMDNDGSSEDPATIGFSTDYPYQTYSILAWYFPNVIDVVPNWPHEGSGQRVLPDSLRAGESRTIRFWLRHKSAVGETASLDACQPYIDYIRENYPMHYPAKLQGRVVASFAADEIGDPAHRQYHSYGGTRVDEFSGWSAYLTAMINFHYTSAANLVANNYVAVMIWLISGFEYVDPPINFPPSSFRNLPPNLASTLNEIPIWEAANGLKVMIWCGEAFVAYQTGAWNSTQLNSLATGYYVDTLPPGWATWTLEPDAVAEWHANLYAWLEYVSGIGLDAMPEAAADPWINDAIRQLREAYPDKYIIGESDGTDRKHQWVAPYYQFNATDFSGRCPMFERIRPGYEPMVQTNGNDPTGIANSLFVEAQGGINVTHGAIVTAPYIPYPPP